MHLSQLIFFYFLLQNTEQEIYYDNFCRQDQTVVAALNGIVHLAHFAGQVMTAFKLF